MRTIRPRPPVPPGPGAPAAAPRGRVPGLALGRPRLAATCALLAALCVGAADPPAAVTPDAGVEVVRTTLAKWLETQKAIAKEERDWQRGREVLQARLDHLRTEIGDVEGKFKQAEGRVKDVNDGKAALVAEDEQLAALAVKLTEAVATMEIKVHQIHARLPEPLQTKLKPLYDRIPAAGAEARVSVAERYQNVLGILNELNRANTDLSVVYEVRNLANGKPAEVRTLYVGLTQAYFVSAGGEAGAGRPTDSGWTWQAAPDQAQQIALALEMMQNKHSPAFVPLPVRLQP